MVSGFLKQSTYLLTWQHPPKYKKHSFMSSTVHESVVNLRITIKALKIRYTLMNCHLVDIHWLSEAFGGARM